RAAGDGAERGRRGAGAGDASEGGAASVAGSVPRQSGAPGRHRFPGGGEEGAPGALAPAVGLLHGSSPARPAPRGTPRVCGQGRGRVLARSRPRTASALGKSPVGGSSARAARGEAEGASVGELRGSLRLSPPRRSRVPTAPEPPARARGLPPGARRLFFRPGLHPVLLLRGPVSQPLWERGRLRAEPRPQPQPRGDDAAGCGLAIG